MNASALKSAIALVAVLLAGAGCRTRPTCLPHSLGVDASVVPTVRYTAPPGCAARYKYDGQPLPDAPSGDTVVVVASEDAFKKAIRCQDQDGKEVDRPSGIDFTKQHLVVMYISGGNGGGGSVRFVAEGPSATWIVIAQSHACSGVPVPPSLSADLLLVRPDRAVQKVDCDLPWEGCDDGPVP